jgi:hypothetical protein
MQTVTTIGLDIAKSVFQVHGIDAEGKVVIRRQLKRRYVLAFFQKLAPCLVGIEAFVQCWFTFWLCGCSRTSADHFSLRPCALAWPGPRRAAPREQTAQEWPNA